MGVAYLPPVRKAFEELADSTVGLFWRIGNGCKSPFTPPVSAGGRCGLRPKLPAFSAANPSIDVRLSSVIWDKRRPRRSHRFGNSLWGRVTGMATGRSACLNQSILPVCSPALLRAAPKNGDIAAMPSTASDSHHGLRESLAEGEAGAETRGCTGQRVPDRRHDRRRIGTRGRPAPASPWRTEFSWTRI